MSQIIRDTLNEVKSALLRNGEYGLVEEVTDFSPVGASRQVRKTDPTTATTTTVARPVLQDCPEPVKYRMVAFEHLAPKLKAEISRDVDPVPNMVKLGYVVEVETSTGNHPVVLVYIDGGEPYPVFPYTAGAQSVFKWFPNGGGSSGPRIAAELDAVSAALVKAGEDELSKETDEVVEEIEAASNDDIEGIQLTVEENDISVSPPAGISDKEILTKVKAVLSKAGIKCGLAGGGSFLSVDGDMNAARKVINSAKIEIGGREVIATRK